MNGELNIHPASDSERIDAYRNVHDLWGGGVSLDEYLRRRLKSVQHNRAAWYVGCVDDRVVTSLGCYPIFMRMHGQVLPTMAVGAVYTVPECRGRRYAPQLIEHVEHDQNSRGILISLLYSDIKPSYYERLGYSVCAGWEANFETATAIKSTGTLTAAENPTELIRCSRHECGNAIKDLHESYHSQFSVSIARDTLYWEYLLAKDTGDEYFQLQDKSDKPIGYVRLRASERTMTIRDFAVADRTGQDLGALLMGVVRAASTRGIAHIGGWLPDHPAAREIGPVVQRQIEITMLKSLDSSIVIGDDVREAAQHFIEIDHV
jgi:GNAT superfamily N-acetyltransferase